MNIAYKITFTNRLKLNIKPYYYIGSKSNCTIKYGIIYDKDNKPYYGSSHYKDYINIVENDNCIIEVLYECDTYNEALLFERDIQIKEDVVANTEYFNLSIATVNNFSDPLYATYKHIIENKVVRLKTDHPLVLDGTYVGVTKGAILNEYERLSRGRSGEENCFYGRTHSEETKSKISASNTGNVMSDEAKLKMSNSRKGIKKSEEHRSKIGRKGFIMLKNINTGENIRIKKEESQSYDKDIWMNPATVKKILKERNK